MNIIRRNIGEYMEDIIIEDGKEIENGGKRVTDLAGHIVGFLRIHTEKTPLIIIFSFLTVLIHLSIIKNISKYQLRNLILSYLEKYQSKMPDVRELKDGKKRKISEGELTSIMDDFFDKNKEFTSQKFEDKIDDIIDTYDILKKKIPQ